MPATARVHCARRRWRLWAQFPITRVAQPLAHRVIRNKIEDTLSDAILAGKFETGSAILVDAAEDEIALLQPGEEEDEREPALELLSG